MTLSTAVMVVWLGRRTWADLYPAVLLVHIGFLILGLGAVLAVDFLAMRALWRRESMTVPVRLASYLHTPIWVGYSGLVGSGLMLSPAWGDPTTQLKLALVFVVGLNGIYAETLGRQLARAGPRPARQLLVRGALSATVSQAAWWGAVAVGFAHAQA